MTWFRATQTARLSLAIVTCVIVAGAVGPACRRSAEPPASPKAAADRDLTPDTEDIRATVPTNTTLAAMLRDHVTTPSAESIVSLIEGAGFDPRKLRAGQPFVLTRTLTGQLRALRYEVDDDRYLLLQPPDPATPGRLLAEMRTYARTVAQTTVDGTIDSGAPSLFGSLERAGESVDLALALADIFAGELDFNSDLQPGDHYHAVFDKITRENGTVAYGPVAAAEFFNDGRNLRGIRFVGPDGKAGYYDEQGRSLKRFFLKSPLKFEPRITSRFSYSRRHPVLGIRRPHLGVDYAAPVGASVVAVSAGVVTRAGFAGQAGRLVSIRHASGYESLYMHLSRIHVRAGQHVSQGHVVGQVGSSGLSTGPHLDYRLKRDGRYVDPIAEHKRLPPGEPIPAALMPAFVAERDKALAMLVKTPRS